MSLRALVVMMLLGAGLAAFWPTYLELRTGQPAPLLTLVAHVCGMLAGYGVVVLLVLMSRAPWLENSAGYDTLGRWHARFGRSVLILVLVHGAAAVASWAQSRQEAGTDALRHVLALPAMLPATVGTVALVAVGVVSARVARRRLPYELWHGFHLVTYAAVAISFLHQLAGPDLAGHRLLQVAWALLYAHAFGLLLRHRLITPVRQAIRHRLRVADVRSETAGVVSIMVTGRYLDELGPVGGQFFRWRFLTGRHWAAAHPFSISAAPSGSALRLTVKALGHGSAFLQTVPIGTRVVTEGPYGAVTAARRTRPGVLLIAGGVGITPIRALFETLPDLPGGDVILLYRARSCAAVIFRDELDQIARTRGAAVHYLVGHDPECLSRSALLRLVPDLVERDVYLCGSPRMAEAVRSAVLAAGLPARRLHEERFAF